jgi:hypothetical protein
VLFNARNAERGVTPVSERRRTRLGHDPLCLLYRRAQLEMCAMEHGVVVDEHLVIPGRGAAAMRTGSARCIMLYAAWCAI